MNTITFKQYLLTYLLVFLPITNWLPFRRELYIIIFLIGAFLFIIRKINIGSQLVKIIILFTIILIIQSIVFGKARTDAIIGLYMSILLPYFAVTLVGKNFLKILVNIVVTITFVSFIFYIPSVLSENIKMFVSNIAPTLGTDVWLSDQNFLIYTSRYHAITSFGLIRNSGNFNEPGYFATILNMALAVNISYGNKLLEKKNLIMIIGIITTFSTSGYIAMIFIISFYLLVIMKKKIKYIIIPIFITIAIGLYTSSDFLQPKIQSHYEIQYEGEVKVGRFGALYADIEDIKKYPLSGRGIISTTRFDEVESWEGDNAPWQTLNGVTNTLVRLGIPGFLIYIILLIKSINYITKQERLLNYTPLLYFAVMLITLSAQNLMMIIYFMSFVYLIDIKYQQVQ